MKNKGVISFFFKKSIFIVLLIPLLFSFNHLLAQNREDTSLLIYSPSISTLMLNKLQWEIGYQISNSSYSYLSTPISELEGGFNFLYNVLQLTTGINKKIAVGIDVSRADNFYKIDNGLDTTFNFLKIGPRIRWSVFQNKHSSFVVQNYFRFPVDIGNNSTIKSSEFVNQFVLSNQVGANFLMTNQFDVLFVKQMESNNKPSIILPYTFFFCYLYNTETVFFSSYQYQFNRDYYYWNDVAYKYSYSANSLGIGAQRRIAKGLLINTYYRFSFKNKYQSLSHSITFGLRYITR